MKTIEMIISFLVTFTVCFVAFLVLDAFVWSKNMIDSFTVPLITSVVVAIVVVVQQSVWRKRKKRRM